MTYSQCLHYSDGEPGEQKGFILLQSIVIRLPKRKGTTFHGLDKIIIKIIIIIIIIKKCMLLSIRDIKWIILKILHYN